MFATRSTSCLLAAATISVMVAGCSRSQQPPVAEYPSEKFVYDESMLQRDWPRTTATYAYGDTDAGPNYFALAYEPRGKDDYDKQQSLAAVVDPWLFVVNMATLPVDMLLHPPSDDVQYEGVVTPPTYSGVPQVPDNVEPPADETAASVTGETAAEPGEMATAEPADGSSDEAITEAAERAREADPQPGYRRVRIAPRRDDAGESSTRPAPKLPDVAETFAKPQE